MPSSTNEQAARFQKLVDKRERLTQIIHQAQGRLETLYLRLKDDFGLDSLEEARQRLDEMKAEHAKRLERIEEILEEIEQHTGRATKS